jgi:hypothetical protein
MTPSPQGGDPTARRSRRDEEEHFKNADFLDSLR